MTEHLPKVAEYETVRVNAWPKSVRVKLAAAKSNLVSHRTIILERVSCGYESAGSMMRLNKGGFRVGFESDGAYHSRQFARLADAEDLFDKWTMPRKTL